MMSKSDGQEIRSRVRVIFSECRLAATVNSCAGDRSRKPTGYLSFNDFLWNPVLFQGAEFGRRLKK